MMTYSVQEINAFASFAERLADAAAKETLLRFRTGSTIFNKAGPWFDPVTDADREAERRQRELIGRFYPTHGIIGEEFGQSKGESGLDWVLDPVDGTRAFICGTPTWATLIALESEGQPVVGLIDQPFTGERWIASNGSIIYRHKETQKSASTSGLTDLSKARISTTDPRKSAYFSAREADLFEHIAHAARVARFSMDAYAYALLAIGQLDVVVETGLQHYDYAALRLVVENAGGIITNWSGEPLGTDGRGEIIASATAELHAAVLAIISDHG